MPLRLVCVAGALEGQEFLLNESGLSVGRGDTNDIVLNEAGVSRRHCLIQAEGADFVICDQGSHNHTWVNGVQVDRKILREGDQITIGPSSFSCVARHEENALPAATTTILRREDAAYLQPHLPVHALHLLLQVVEAMSAGGSLDALAERLLQLVREVLPVTTAGIFLVDDDEPEAYCWPNEPGAGPTRRLPKAILQRVMDEKVSICTSDVIADALVDPTNSVLNLPTPSIVAVPIVAEDRVAGVIHGAAARAVFHPDHLQLLTGVAAMAASHLASALRVQKLEKANVRLQQQIQKEANLVGSTRQMFDLHSVIAKVAPAASTVLIVGETGTGKELVATAIHRNSSRASKPLVAINCAALTETLLESELFGHEKGAFTGAVAQKRGKFEEAAGGTIFLDEIGELAQSIQAKLLRVLQERTVTRVGGNRAIPVDVRVLAATNRDLRAMVSSGEFRQDLYYRLNVITIQTPALRDRRSDIPALVDHFIGKHARNAERRVSGVSARALQRLARYDWPGNVRELENVIERAIVLGSTETIVPDDLPDTLLESVAGEESLTSFHEKVNDAKRLIISGALQDTQGNYSEAARLLGIHPNNLHRLIRNLGIKTSGKGSVG